MKCSTTRRMIDQADDPASLRYETAAHIEGCSSCRQFASEREQLRKLLLEPRRVAAPANFEAMVARRLAERGGSRAFRPAIGFYLRAAGAAAALACLVLVIQTTRFSPVSQVSRPSLDQLAEKSLAEKPPVHTENRGVDNPPPVQPFATVIKAHSRVHPGRRGSQGSVRPESPLALAADIAAQPRALLLVRNAGSEQEIAVPMVTVGAQPWMPVNVSSQDARGLRMAF